MNITKLLTETSENIGEDTVHVRSYSGRGMYGHQCLAITGPMKDCMCLIVHTLKESADEMYGAAIDSDDDYQVSDALRSQHLKLIDTLLDYKQDSMGYDVVLYWPDIEYTEPQEDDSN